MPDDVPPEPTRAPVPATAADSNQLRWRVSGGALRLKVVGALGFAVLTVLGAGDPIRLAVAGLAAVVLASYAVRDLVAPVRLAADPDGVTVIAGFAGTRRLAWSQIERVRLDERRRLGLRSELVEIDAGDSLHLFGPYDLGAPCAEVVEALTRLRTGTS
jgi:hypothetical protein